MSSDSLDMIFFEAQVDQLCAQHALNMLLQSEKFNVEILSYFVEELDESERNLLSNDRQNFESQNANASGFYSIQVIERALQQFDLNIEQIGRHGLQNYTTNNAAYICNKGEHWFTVRRFRFNNRWFILDSTLKRPVPISEDHLNMLFAQFTADEYHIFAVKGELPSCDADLVEFPPPPRTMWQLGDGRQTPTFEQQIELAMKLSLEDQKRKHGPGPQVNLHEDEELQRVLEESKKDARENLEERMLEKACLMSLKESGAPPLFTYKPLRIAKCDSSDDDETLTTSEKTNASGAGNRTASNSVRSRTEKAKTSNDQAQGSVTTAESSDVGPACLLGLSASSVLQTSNSSAQQPSTLSAKHSSTMAVDLEELRRKRLQYINQKEALTNKKNEKNND